MGVLFSRVFDSLFGSKEHRILIVGLDNAGKTTILHKLHSGNAVTTTVPTIGFNVENVEFQNVKLSVWDLGGQSSIRPYWRCYYNNTSGIVFVVDSSDAQRLSIAKQELMMMLEDEELRGVPLLVFANKADLAESLPDAQISVAMGLTHIRGRPWTLQRASATKGEGIEDGFSWLTRHIRKS
eukprot:ANDGO_08089.mRNA.1 ADP-ribosylation factor 1